MITLIRHHEIVELDMHDRGLDINDLGTKKLTWRYFYLYVKHCTKADSRLFEAVNGAHWSIAEQLAAIAINDQRNINAKKGSKPELLEAPQSIRKRQVGYGYGAIPASSFDDWWDSKDKK